MTSSSRINLAGDLPVIEHIQSRTQALMAEYREGSCDETELLRAQSLDLLDDVKLAGHDQSVALMMCIEAIRHLGQFNDDDDTSIWTGGGMELRYSTGLMPGQGSFVAMDIARLIENAAETDLVAALEIHGPPSEAEKEDGLPDPERLVLAAAVVILALYVSELGGMLLARYLVEDVVILACAQPLPDTGRLPNAGA